MDSRLDLYTSIVPNRRQLIIQDMKYYAFVHYGMNTFTNREWGDGKESESIFNPKKQNTDQWCEAIAAAGMIFFAGDNIAHLYIQSHRPQVKMIQNRL